MKFRAGNKYKYRQDFFTYIGIPAGIEFGVEPLPGEKFRLEGPGYGEKSAYGNGHLYVWGLTRRQRAAFAKVI